MDPKEILLYQTASKKVPFRDWLLSIKEETVQARIWLRIDRLALGNFGDSKSVGGIFELRLHFGPGYRIYFAPDGNALVILLCGGDKSSQTQDIKKAQKFWRDYLWRKAK